MARHPRDPDSASCQFYICLSRLPALDGEQTAFGYVVGDLSFDTLRKIGQVPTGPGPQFRPERPVYIRAISLENVPARERDVNRNGSAPQIGTRPAGVTGAGPFANSPLPPAPVSDRYFENRRPEPESQPAAESGS